MRLASVSVNRSTSIAQSPHQVDKLLALPLESVVVIINQDSIRPSLMRHLKRLDDPVVTGLAITTQSSLVRSRLVSGHSLVHHINHRQVRIFTLHSIHPFHNLFILLFSRKLVQPSRVLRAPNQAVELEREIVLLRIVVGIVTSTPIPSVVVPLNRRPLRLILRSNLIPERVELLIAEVHIVARRNVAQKLVRIGRQLRISLHATKSNSESEKRPRAHKA